MRCHERSTRSSGGSTTEARCICTPAISAGTRSTAPKPLPLPSACGRGTGRFSRSGCWTALNWCAWPSLPSGAMTRHWPTGSPPIWTTRYAVSCRPTARPSKPAVRNMLTQLLLKRGWERAEVWTTFHRGLSDPVEDCGLRIETIEPDRAQVWVAVHWSAFRGSPFTDADRRSRVGRWLAMAGGPFYGDGRFLAAFDANDDAVAVAAVLVSRPRAAGTAGTDGRPPQSPRPRVRHSDHACRCCDPSRHGFVQRECVRAKLQHRRRRHLRLGRLHAVNSGGRSAPRAPLRSSSFHPHPLPIGTEACYG